MADPPDRVHRSELLACVPGSSDETFDHRSGDEGGCHRVRSNAAAGEFECGGLGQTLDGVLARVVKAEIGNTDMPAMLLVLTIAPPPLLSMAATSCFIAAAIPTRLFQSSRMNCFLAQKSFSP